MIRRHGTSTPPWSSTSPSTSSCRWFLARRWCTPTTSSSSRCPTHKAFRWWFPKNAFDGTFQDGYFDGYDPYTNPSAASGFTSAAFRWKKSVFYFVLKRRGFGRQLNWPASQSAAFCGREILLTLQKSASTWPPWRRANSFLPENISILVTGLGIRFSRRLLRGGRKPTGETHVQSFGNSCFTNNSMQLEWHFSYIWINMALEWNTLWKPKLGQKVKVKTEHKTISWKTLQQIILFCSLNQNWDQCRCRPQLSGPWEARSCLGGSSQKFKIL